MADEPSWEEIFRPAETPKPTPSAGPEPTVPGNPTVRASDPFAVAAAEAQQQAQWSAAQRDTGAPPAPGAEQPLTRRQLREMEQRGETPRRPAAPAEGSARADAPSAPPATQEPTRRGGGSGGGRGRGRTFDESGRSAMPPAKKKRNLWWLWTLIAVLVVGAGAAGTVWVLFEDEVREVLGWELPNDYEGTGNGVEVVVVIQSGDFGDDVARTLHDEGVTMSFDAVWDYLLENPTVTFTPGSYRLEQEMSAEAAVEALRDPANRIVNQVTIPEGSSYPQALELIAAGSEIPLAELEAAAADYTQFGVPAEAPSIEGFLFPATYQFDPDVTAVEALQQLVDEMFSRLDEQGVAPEDRLTILTKAALVQRESGPNVEDMYKIARVFQNRLDQGMLLQSDASVHYGIGDTSTVWTTDAERADASNPYNTYANEGLPIGPIGLPGEDAIAAVLDPTDGPWLYFVTVNLATGETVFSTTIAEHEAAVAQLRAWCRASDENASYCE